MPIHTMGRKEQFLLLLAISLYVIFSKFLAVNNDQAKKTLFRYRQEFESSVLGLQHYHNIDPYEFYDAVYGSLDLSKMSPYDGLADSLRRLSTKVSLYVLTNSNKSFTNKAISLLNLDNIFTKIITVEDNGFIRKPNKEVYNALFTRHLRMPPSNIAIFDDIASNLKVVQKMGVVTVLVSNGLCQPPYFSDLHTGEEFKGKPDFVQYSTHNISGFINLVSS
jgi:pyrimidine 5'-nucleotidase